MPMPNLPSMMMSKTRKCNEAGWRYNDGRGVSERGRWSYSDDVGCVYSERQNRSLKDLLSSRQQSNELCLYARLVLVVLCQEVVVVVDDVVVVLRLVD